MNDTNAKSPMFDPAAEATPAAHRRRKRGVRVTTAAAVALGLAVGGATVAGAASTTSSPPSSSTSTSQPGRPPIGGGTPPAAVGTVKSVGDGTFTITSQDGTAVTVNVSSTTTYRDMGVTSASIANITVGEHVAVFGSDTSSTVTATSVAIGIPPAGGKGGPVGAPGGKGGTPPAAVGTVKSVGDGTFTITAQDGTAVTVNVSSTTTYRDSGVTSASIANITVGEHVAVFGSDTSNTVTATSVAIGNPPVGGMGGPMGTSSGSPDAVPGGSGGTPPTTGSGSSASS